MFGQDGRRRRKQASRPLREGECHARAGEPTGKADARTGSRAKRLDKFIGKWEFKGRTLDSDQDNVFGTTTFEWLPGGFFLLQRIDLDFIGMGSEGLELIGYDPETKTFPSTVYSNLSPARMPYKWEVGDDTLTISVSSGPLDATFEGRFSEDRESYTGSWRPNPGADETVNVPYDITGRRAK